MDVKKENGLDETELVEAIRKGYWALQDATKGIVNPDWLAEATDDACSHLDPAVFGQLLMKHLPDCDEARMDTESKQFWIAVAEHMGADWIESFRRVAMFMVKVDQF